MKVSINDNDAACYAYYRLAQAGGKLYVVGGAVRDAMLGEPYNDIDLLVTGLNEKQIKQVLPGAFLTGESFGVWRYKTAWSEVEIAMPRTEVSTGPGHKDFDTVVDSNIRVEEDLGRRDFTVNAMAWDIAEGKLIDPWLGTPDCDIGCVDTVFDSAFEDDPLRVLRAFVLVSRYSMFISTKAQRLMQASMEGLKHLPAERIQEELDKIFEGRYVADAVSAMQYLGVLNYIFPELAEHWDYDQNNPHHQRMLGSHSLNTLWHVANISTDKDLRLGALLHDVGKPYSEWVDPITGMNHFYRKKVGSADLDKWGDKCPKLGTELGADHEVVGADINRIRLTGLKYPTKRIDRIVGLTRWHMWAPFTTEKGARKFLNKYGELADDLLILRYGDNGGKGVADHDRTGTTLEKQKEMLDAVRFKGEATKTSDLAINGHDLIKAGFKPGPDMGKILNYLTDVVLDQPDLNNKNELIDIAKGHSFD